MSDIPVGSPPVPPGRHAAPGGWYPDPAAAGQERYWDGWQWTRNVRPLEGMPVQQPYGQNPYGQQSHQQYGQQQYGHNPYTPQPGQQGLGPQVPRTADGVPLAGWWWRVLATVLDSLITGAVYLLIAAPIWIRVWQQFSVYFSEVMAAASAGDPPPAQPNPSDFISPTDSLIITAISLGVVVVYSVLFLRWKRATPGQLIVGLRVVPVDQGQFSGSLEWSRILLRVAIWVLPAITIYLSVFRILDALWPLWQPKRQALHDLAAKTQVVKIS